ncbi:MAG: hypothetical protein H3C62_11755 [Gemmatimonadaceae bacterium]|nr:hypothetical protein [Gemmatimonadaceae bacterium]
MQGRLVSRVIRVLYWAAACALAVAALLKFTPVGALNAELTARIANVIRFLPYVSFGLMLVLQLAPEGRRPEFLKDNAFGDAWAGIFSMYVLIWTFNVYHVGNASFSTLETEWPIGIVVTTLALCIRIVAILWYRAQARSAQSR